MADPDWTMITRGSKQVSVTGVGDKRDTFFSNKIVNFFNWLIYLQLMLYY